MKSSTSSMNSNFSISQIKASESKLDLAIKSNKKKKRKEKKSFNAKGQLVLEKIFNGFPYRGMTAMLAM